MARDWIEFDEGPEKAAAGEIYASMNKEGEILVNGPAYDEMGSPEAVTLLFDPATDTIGLRPASRRMPNAFLVRKKGDSGHRRIGAKRFAKKYEISLDGTVRFRNAAVEDGILVLSLRNIQNIKRKSANPRARRSSAYGRR